jgi:hypothetical protein
VAYHSKALNAAERNYSIGDREFLAIIEGLKRIRHLVMGSPYKLIIYTDHNNLRYYRHPQKLNRHVARYIAFLADFDFELVLSLASETKQIPYPDVQTMTTDQQTMKKPQLCQTNSSPEQLKSLSWNNRSINYRRQTANYAKSGRRSTASIKTNGRSGGRQDP